MSLESLLAPPTVHFVHGFSKEADKLFLSCIKSVILIINLHVSSDCGDIQQGVQIRITHLGPGRSLAENLATYQKL